jgi:hypothetical protein
MTNKNLIILGLLAIGVYAYLEKNKKDQSKPYSDAELDKLIADFVNKAEAYAKSNGRTESRKNHQEVIDQTKFIFINAKAKGKDLSKANVDKFFKLFWISVLNQEGDSSQGISTKEDIDFLMDFMSTPQPVQHSQGFFPQVPKDPKNSQISNWGLAKEQCEKAGKKYTSVDIQCIKAPCGGGFGICE